MIQPAAPPAAGAVRGRMRAAVLVDVGRIDVQDVACPPPGPREVLVRVTAVGLCGTDLHIGAVRVLRERRLASVRILRGARDHRLTAPVGASGGFEADGRPSTYRQALTLIECGQVEVASLISHRYSSLDSVARAFTTDHAAPDYVNGVVTL